jgi:hypothetical protein
MANEFKFHFPLTNSNDVAIVIKSSFFSDWLEDFPYIVRIKEEQTLIYPNSTCFIDILFILKKNCVCKPRTIRSMLIVQLKNIEIYFSFPLIIQLSEWIHKLLTINNIIFLKPYILSLHIIFNYNSYIKN